MRIPDLVYPRTCAVCSAQIIEADRLSVCVGCETKGEWIEPPACSRCGVAGEGSVLLVDDVLATGGTANGCAQALRAAGGDGNSRRGGRPLKFFAFL